MSQVKESVAIDGHRSFLNHFFVRGDLLVALVADTDHMLMSGGNVVSYSRCFTLLNKLSTKGKPKKIRVRVRVRKKKQTHTPTASKWPYSIHITHVQYFHLTIVYTTSVFLKMLVLSFKITQPLLEK